MSEVQQSNQATIRRAHTYDGSLVVRAMGIRHHGSLPNSLKIAKISSSRYRLLHQVGGSGAPCHYHEEKHPYLRVEKHHLQIRDSEGACL